MDLDVAHQLEHGLGQLMLRRNRDNLCNAVIADAPPGVDRQTYPLLTGLARLGPQPTTRLAEEIGVDRSGISRYADRLQNAGLLVREPDPDDRRVTLLRLTPRGLEAAENLHTVLTDHLRKLISTWPPGQAEALVQGIRRLLDTTPPVS